MVTVGTVVMDSTLVLMPKSASEVEVDQRALDQPTIDQLVVHQPVAVVASSLPSIVLEA